MRRIVSLYLPMWPINRLRRAEPSAVPADRPLALVEAGARGLIITAVNAAALRQGIYCGLSLADARAALPHLLSRRAEAGKDRVALLKLARWAGRYGPCRHADGDDGLWVDITGVAHLYGGEDALLQDVICRLSAFGVEASAGLADTLAAAHALARHGSGGRERFVCAPQGQNRQALAALPVEALRLESDAVRLLKRLGLRRIGDLYDLPRDSLARRFRSKDDAGRVLTRLDQALGLKAEPRRPLIEPPVLSAVRSFAEPLMSSEALLACVEALGAEICALMADKELGARGVRLSLYRADGSTAEVFAALSAPSREAAHILRLLDEKIAHVDAGFGVDLLRLDVVRAEALAARAQSLSGKDSGRGMGEGGGEVRSPALLIDRLSNRLGAATITLLRPRQSHIPERAEVRIPALRAASPVYEPPWPYARQTPGPTSSPTSSQTSRATSTETPRQTSKQTCRRPPFLLPRPESIEVLAEVPDGPPARFTWRRVERRVVRSQGPERLAPEWWQHIREADGRAAEGQKPARPRDYYMIEDETGAAYWVFRHGLYGREDEAVAAPPAWFLHGLFA